MLNRIPSAVKFPNRFLPRKPTVAAKGVLIHNFLDAYDMQLHGKRHVQSSVTALYYFVVCEEIVHRGSDVSQEFDCNWYNDRRAYSRRDPMGQAKLA